MSVISSLLVKIGVDVDDIQKGIDEGQAAIKSGATKFMAAGAVAGLAVGAGVLGAMNVEAANDKLTAQLGLSAKESERIGGVAGKLYAGAYGGSLEEVNTAVGAVMSSIDGMANASSAKIEAVTAKALDFATAFEVDVQRAAQVAGQAVSTGLAKNATEAFDLITAASQRVPANLREDVLDAADEYGQFFATLGYDGEQAFAMLVDGSKKGMYGIDKAGDAIKEFTIRSTDMSTASKDAYSAIGLDAQDMANAILKGGDSAQGATQKIIDGLLNIKDPAKQANAAIALFGTPLEDLNVKEIPTFLKSLKSGSDAMDGFKGASERMGQSLNDNAATNLESFKRQAIQTFVNVVGGAVLPMVNNVASALATGLGPAVSAVTGFLSEHAAIVKPVAVALGTMAAVVGTIIGITKVWTMVQAALNVVMAMNPIGLVVVALVGLAAGLVYAYKKSETFRNIVNGAFDAVKTVVLAVVNWFKTAVPAAWDAVRNATVSAWNAVKSAVTSAVNAVKATVSAAWNAIKSATVSAGNAIKSAVTSAWNAVKAVVSSVTNAIKAVITTAWGAVKAVVLGAVGAIKTGVQNAFNNARDLVKGAMAAIKAVVTGDIGRVVELFGALLGRIKGALGNVAGALYGVGRNIVLGLINGIKSMVGAVVGATGDVVGSAINAAKSKLGIKSPSRVFMEIGHLTGEGMRIGLADMQGPVERQLSRLAVPGATRTAASAPGVAAAGSAAPGADSLADKLDRIAAILERMPRDYRVGERTR